MVKLTKAHRKLSYSHLGIKKITKGLLWRYLVFIQRAGIFQKMLSSYPHKMHILSLKGLTG